MKKIKRVLIANRGEIALRITKTLKELDLEVVAVYEKPDSDAYHLRFVDKAVLIGDGPVTDYLNIDKIIRAALENGADAVHPGYGFLSENAAFADACKRAGLIFIGPPGSVIRNLGDKLVARGIASGAGLPLIPATDTLPQGNACLDAVQAFAAEHGYPVMLKALAGGGGRGIRIVRDATYLKMQLGQVQAEASLAFGDERIYVEKVIEKARHIEVQILADVYGNVVHLGTRDCSIQRRQQKLLEIAPAHLPPSLAETLHGAAVDVAKAAGYVGAGTVEFLVRPDTKEYWFLEVNPRLQVEHTVTEMITGFDIVRRQILIAEGRALDFHQEEVRIKGIAVEVRINTEDPHNDFMPEGGKHIDMYNPPGGPGIRLDGAIYRGYRIPAVYDSLLVKLIVWGYEWEQTIKRLKRTLSDFTIVGPKTTIPLYLSICDESHFQNQDFDTGYLEAHQEIFNYPEHIHYMIEDTVYKAKADDVEQAAQTAAPRAADSDDMVALAKKKHVTAQDIETLRRVGVIRSPIKGKIVKVFLEIGEEVLAGDILIDLEAMKMHTHIMSEVDGRISDILVEPGDAVDVGDTLMTIQTGA